MSKHDEISLVQVQKRPGGGSDRTLKKNVMTIHNVLDRVVSLRPVTWNWKSDKEDRGLQYGFIAQEVEEVFPDLVSENTWNDGSTRKFLSTNDMLPYLVGSIKEQQQQIVELKKQITKLKLELSEKE